MLIKRSKEESMEGVGDEAWLGESGGSSLSLLVSDLSLVSEGACSTGTSANILSVRPCNLCC